MSILLSRRNFIKAGLAGTLALAAAGMLYRTARDNVSPVAFVFDAPVHAILAAIIPVVLKDALAGDQRSVAAAIARVQSAVSGLPLSTQKEVQDLFGLLRFGPARRFLAGLPEDWPLARVEDIDAFLQSWRTHRFGMLQSAYLALHDLITGSWYADESTWASIGYPGPIKELS
jgi:TAT (twin-arginine translocation) pathway signal sequence